jgi:hypothetical protein
MSTIQSLTPEEKMLVSAGIFMPVIDVAQADAEAHGTFQSILTGVVDVFSLPAVLQHALEKHPQKTMIEGFIQELQDSTHPKDKDAAAAVEEKLKTAGKMFSEQPMEVRYAQIAVMLENRFPAVEADALKQYMLLVGKEAAARTGEGFLGLKGEVSEHEQVKLQVIARALRAESLL